MIYGTVHQNCLDLNNRTSRVLRALVIVSQKCLRFGRFFSQTHKVERRKTKMRCKVDKRIAVSKNLFVWLTNKKKRSRGKGRKSFNLRNGCCVPSQKKTKQSMGTRRNLELTICLVVGCCWLWVAVTTTIYHFSASNERKDLRLEFQRQVDNAARLVVINFRVFLHSINFRDALVTDFRRKMSWIGDLWRRRAAYVCSMFLPGPERVNERLPHAPASLPSSSN